MNKLTELGYKYNTDKSWFHKYTDFYFEYFKNLKNPRIIEIGTAGHGSVKMFIDFFSEVYVVGLDIINYSGYTHPNYRFVVGDQSNENDLMKLIKDEDKFDIILDDGGHMMKQQQTSFGFLFDYVKDDGIYIIEDIHTSFNKSFIDGDCEYTTYEMLKKIEQGENNFSNYIKEKERINILNKVDNITFYSYNEKFNESLTSIIKKR